jgi:ABC-2 type transport system permease protein
MRFAVMRIMLLNLWRDRGALAIGFILPGIVYIIFAGIFSGAATGDVKIRLALFDERQSVESITLADAIRAHPAVIEVSGALSAEQARKLVQTGSADVAAVIRDNGTGFDSLCLVWMPRC